MNQKVLLNIRDKTSNILGALFYSYFCYIHLTSFFVENRISSLLLVALETVLIFSLLFRNPPKNLSLSFYDWTIAAVGTLSPLLMRPASVIHDIAILYIVQVIGVLISLTGVIALNKNFGFVAANRGIKTGGMYRLIRHPIYLGYFLTIGAYVIQNSTSANITLFIIWGSFQILRIIAEEAFLSSDSSYMAYKKKTRWHLIPFIW